MTDQKRRFDDMGICAEFTSETHHDLDTVFEVREGRCQLVFICLSMEGDIT